MTPIRLFRSQMLSSSRLTHRPTQPITFRASYQARQTSCKSVVDQKIEEIQEQYATAKDEYEIAYEETEKNTTYAEEDRKAAREELDRLQAIFRSAVEGTDKEIREQVQQRVGQRIRELDSAVKAMEELAMNQD